MQFLVNLTSVAYLLDGFSVLTTWQNISVTATQSSLLPTSASIFKQSAMPSTSSYQAQLVSGTFSDFRVGCTSSQEKAIEEVRDFGRRILELVQGLPRSAHDDKSFGSLSAADLRDLEERYFGRDIKDEQRVGIRG